LTQDLALNFFQLSGDSAGSHIEASVTNTPQQVAQFFKGIQLRANEPIKSRLVKSFRFLKDRIIAMSSGVRQFSNVRKSKNFDNPVIKLTIFSQIKHCLDYLIITVDLFVNKTVEKYGQCLENTCKDDEINRFDTKLRQLSEDLKFCILGWNF
jgi:hypothetical protein